jgi:hypothetical protein
MKTKEEIEQLADKAINKAGYTTDDFIIGFEQGYTQRQEDMATTKEFMSKETLDELFNLHDDDDFIDGDMADKKYTFNQITDAMAMAREINGKETYYKYSMEEILNSLNKLD